MSDQINMHEKPIGHALWRAGAGAGKTFNLVKRVLRIEEEWQLNPACNNKSPRLVVTTFTRMATQELRVRLMEAALASPRREELIPFVTSRNHLFVTTMHGVMDQYLRTYGSAIGLEPGFRIMGGEELETMVRRVGKSVLFSSDEILDEYGFSRALSVLQKLSKTLREHRRDGIPHAIHYATETDFVRLAVIGFQSLMPPLSELIDEISQSAAAASWEEFIVWLRRGLSLIQNQTTANHVQTLTELLLWQEARPAISNRGKKKIDFSAGSDWSSPYKAVFAYVEKVEEERLATGKLVRLNKELETLEKEFTKLLMAEKLKQGLLELDDLEIMALELIREAPETATSFSQTWDHWLIDEYQDTSPRQVELIKALAGDRPQFIVGDPQQSIYLFRGARPGVFYDKENEVKLNGLEYIDLMGNRRSHPEVMAFINQVIKGLGREFQEMTSVRALQDKYGFRDESVSSPLGSVNLLLVEPVDGGKADENRRKEARSIGAAITQLLKAGARPASIAVLASKNSHLSYVARELASLGVPFQQHTSGAYADRIETADLCAIIGFLANPHDDDGFIHVARTPWLPLDERLLVKGFRRKNQSLWSALEQSEEKPSEGSDTIGILREALSLVESQGIVRAFSSLLEKTDFFSWCGTLDPSGRREANALKFISKLTEAERQPGFLPRKFTDEILAGDEKGPTSHGESSSNDRDAASSVKPDRVHLMTIHASKGLEFDHVILPFLNTGIKSQTRFRDNFVFHETERIWSAAVSIDEEGNVSSGSVGRHWNETLFDWGIEESKRVLYVALTRARESLFLIASVSVDSQAEKNSFLSLLNAPLRAGPWGACNVVTKDIDAVKDFLNESSTKQERNFEKWNIEEAAQSRTDRQTHGRVANMQLADMQMAGSVSVTGLIEKSESERRERKGLSGIAASVERSEKPLRQAQAIARGTRLHHIFEAIQKQKLNSRSLILEETERWFLPEEKDAAFQAVNWVLDLKEPDMNSILLSGNSEWSFAYYHPREKVIVEGQIDLWGFDLHGRIWLIDYKTGSSFFQEKALQQLSYYAEALIASGILSGQSNDAELYLAAVFPFSQEVFVKKRPVKEIYDQLRVETQESSSQRVP